MANPAMLFDAAATLAETKAGKAVVEEVTSIAERLFHPGAGRELTAANQMQVLDSPVKGLVESYKPPIPETLDSYSLLKAGPNEIASALDPNRDRLLAIRLHDASKAWGSTKHVKISPSVDGVDILPTMELTAERPGAGNLAVWSDGRAKIGEEAFLTPLNPSKAGSTIHEMTHHEQGFLMMSRVADKMGLTKARPNEEVIAKIAEEMKNNTRLEFSPPIVTRFMDFRAGRQLTAAAADRADKLATSFKGLFDRPVDVLGGPLQTRINNIEWYQGLVEGPKGIDETKGLLTRLMDDKQGPKFAREIFSADTADANRELLLSSLPKADATTWSAESLKSWRDVFGDALDDLHVSTSKLKRSWDRDYSGALHEREARFNQYIAENSLREHLSNYLPPTAKAFWQSVQVHL